MKKRIAFAYGQINDIKKSLKDYASLEQRKTYLKITKGKIVNKNKNK